MIRYGLGLKKSPYDERDVLMSSFLEEIALPDEFDLTNKLTPVRNQGKEGSCAGFAGAGVKEYQEQIDHRKLVKLSPRFIYELAKKKSGHREGTTLRAICDVLREYGICLEDDWPYNANITGFANEDAFKNAEKYKINTYARILDIEELKRTLFQDYPRGGATLIGIKLYKGIFSKQSKDTGACPNPGCLSRSIGGHAVLACGWDDDSPYYKSDGHIKCKGSWGERFGDSGYHYFSYKYIRKNMLDAMAMVDVETPDVMRVADLDYREKRLWV